VELGNSPGCMSYQTVWACVEELRQVRELVTREKCR